MAAGAFRNEPGSGEILYYCTSCAPSVDCAGVVYRDSGGTYPFAPSNFNTWRNWLPGYDGIALRYSETVFLLETASGVIDVATDLSVFDDNSYEIRAVRAIPEGYRVITVEESHVFSAFIVARDGTVSLEGAYPAWTDTFSYPGDCKLEGDGALVCQTYRVGASANVVLRFELGAPNMLVVHHQGNHPAVQPTAIGPITGP